MAEPARASWRIFRFHLRVGARLALAVLVGAIAFVVGALAFLREDFLQALGLLLFGTSGSLPAAALLLGSAVAVAAVAAPRVASGLGWLRHLPAAGASHRRALTAAVALAQLPWIAILTLLVGAARHPGAPTAAHLAGLPVIALTAAQVSLRPWLRPAALPLALTAGLLGGLGTWPTLAAALALSAAADLAAGTPHLRRRLHPKGAPGLHREPREDPVIGTARARWLLEDPAGAAARARWLLPMRIGWRALGRGRLRAYALALLPWLAALFFCRNNPLSPALLTRVALLGGGISSTLLLAALAATLGARRPPWPWSRSLPWTGRRRVLDDASLLGLHALPLLALTGALSPAAMAPLAALLPLLAMLAAGALRRPAAAGQGAARETVVSGLLLAGLAALLPWTAVAMLAAAPAALRAAAVRERRLKVGIWQERRHLAAGDPLSWSGG